MLPDASAFLSRAHQTLIQNQLLKHIYAALAVLGETIGEKRHELVDTAKKYATVTVTNKGT